MRWPSAACLLVAIAGLASAAEPVPFNHQKHANLRRPCEQCHAGAVKNASAGFPDAAQCQACHTKLHTYAALSVKHGSRLKPCVIFSHAAHARAEVGCAECHGDVGEQERLAKLPDVTMTACMDCHQDRQASLACNLCHELGQ